MKYIKKVCLLCVTFSMIMTMAACGKSSANTFAPQNSDQEPQRPAEPTIEWVPVETPALSTSASSTYSGDRATHDAMNLLDGNHQTNWTEGVQGDGIGEYVQFDFVGGYLINAIFIYPGNQYNKNRYLDNSRPENVTVTFSDGSSLSFTLKDLMEGQAMVLPEPVVTESVRITIDSVFHGAKYTDTVISDVSFDAYVPAVS